MKYKIFGCKVNKFYINKWIGYFSENNLDNVQNHLIATCVVTDRAKNKRLKDVFKNLSEGKNIYITGCGVFDKGKLIDQKKFYSIYPELKLFQSKIFLLPEEPEQGNSEAIKQGNSEAIKQGNSEAIKQGNSKAIKQGNSEAIKQSNLYTKKFILIQNGCDNFCTFCLTIMKRGKHQSRPLQEIINEINDFSLTGGKEIVLTGINLAARGCENTNKTNQSQFSFLLQKILNQTTIPRIRISSVGPEYLDDLFFEIIKNPRIMPHFHISIQHFSDKILQSMNRNYNSTQIIYVLKNFQNLKREVPISIGADLIIGFPGETDSDFQSILDGISNYNITKIHSFPFSGHTKGESVPAGKFSNQVPHAIKLQRNKQLKLLGDQIREVFLDKNKGVQHAVLIEEYKNNKRQGWTENYIQVKLDGDYSKGDIITTIY